MALGSTQPLTEMSTRSISWVERQPVHKSDTLPPSCAIVKNSGSLNFLEPSAPPRPVTGLLYLYLLLPISDGPSIFCLSGDKVDLSKRICLLLLTNVCSFTLVYCTGTSHIVAETVQ